MTHNRRQYYVRDYSEGPYGNSSNPRSDRPNTSQYRQQGLRGEGSAQEELWDRWRLVFKGGVLRDGNGHKFRFDAYHGDREANTERYKEVGEIIGSYVYELLKNEGKLSKYYVGSEKGTFIFASKNWRTCDRLLVLIHGSGEIRAGQWSRSLIINDSLESGTQLPYIEVAHRQGWGVIVMNTNDNHDYEGSKSPNEHGSYVWKHCVGESKAQKIAIVAHSAGGSVTASMVSKYLDDFKKRVCAIALADSYGCPDRSDAQRYFEKVTRNWVTGTSPLGKPISGEGVPSVSAGTTNHEEVPHSAKVSIFQYIHGKFENINQNSNVHIDDPSRPPKSKREKYQFADAREKKSAADVLMDAWGLQFDGAGVLRDNNRRRFRFDVTTNHQTNKERYDQIAKVVQAHVYDMLQSTGRLQKYYLNEKKGTFIFVSEHSRTCDKLLVLIHGSGEVRAGQWSRRLIINDSLESGSQLPYIEEAHRRGWGVVVMNTNDQHDCKGSKSAIEHGLYVWKQVVLKSKAKKIAIVAHSAGGSVTASLISKYLDDFRKRVNAIAYTDAFGSPRNHGAFKYFKQVTCNWVVGAYPVGTVIPGRDIHTVSAGTIKHEETSNRARDDIFNFIEHKFEGFRQSSAHERTYPDTLYYRDSASSRSSGNFELPHIQDSHRHPVRQAGTLSGAQSPQSKASYAYMASKPRTPDNKQGSTYKSHCCIQLFNPKKVSSQDTFPRADRQMHQHDGMMGRGAPTVPSMNNKRVQQSPRRKGMKQTPPPWK